MKITVDLAGAGALKAQLAGYARQVPYATRQALNVTAEQVRTAVYDAMRTNFDRPTPTTLKSLYIRYAKKTDLSAEVFVKDRGLGKNNAGDPNDQAEQGSMAQILRHEFTGGQRIAKRIEQAFRAHGYLRAGEYLAPGPDAKMDRYGNMSRGQVSQIYTALRLNFDVSKNPTGSRRSQRHAVAAGRLFWSLGPPLNQAVRRGLWATDGKHHLKLILVPIPRAVYRQRIDLAAITRTVVPKIFPGIFQDEMAKAIQTAR